MRVYVLDKNKRPLMPCSAFRARKLMRKGKAKVYRLYPFTIILLERKAGDLQSLEFKVDPGSKTTGIAIVANFARGHTVVWAANLIHRGQAIREAIAKRRAMRRSRRNRKTRYRRPRFNNRRRQCGWLAPSLRSRVENIFWWAKKLLRFTPISQILAETVRFDTQKMQDAEIAGVEYQQGELFGYEVREYLLEKWGRKCAYCDRENIPLQIEHIIAKSNGGTNRISNLTLSCQRCNQRKGTKNIRDFLARDQKRLVNIIRCAKAPLKDAAAVNATRYAVGNALQSLSLPVTFASGGRTKYNRTKQDYEKDHWIDAACIGQSGENVKLLKDKPVILEAKGRGTRQVCRVDQYGFPRTSAKTTKRIQNFQTGDLVLSRVKTGKKTGYYFGRVAVRASGNFNITTERGLVQGISYKFCRKIHSCDGYGYT